MARRKKTPWQKIVRAAENGTGLRLTADEVAQLGRDGAIETKASNDDMEDEGWRMGAVKVDGILVDRWLPPTP